MKRWNRDMHKYDLNIIILGQIVHKNEVNYTFEIFNLYPTLKGTHLTLTLTLTLTLMDTQNEEMGS